MYHGISKTLADGLTVKKEDLEQQFLMLKTKGYTPFFFREFLNTPISELPQKPIILTFDDAYQNNAE